ncbi:hypothetical protein JQC67_14340 [Aurantibacter crassamenti]|uniref:hypothetical protein n=1 Tax=Aurantibacter crassamenti TaxID=1837375 RepID=UPI00193AC447|nr:hypothetical protein [Aurantibacter crassamenti]MBM1107330.1 hypothetical protein [Aurantibacter crassamenti]
MVPIQEQGEKSGIGYSYKQFLKRFFEICEKHLSDNRAKSFAFIFYEFHNQQIRDIFKNRGGFTRLDRLSGKDLSVFYIDSENKRLVQEFNEIFLGAFEIQDKTTLPCVVFFKMEDSDVEDVQIVELSEPDRMFAFEELFSSIEDYLKDSQKIITPKRNILPELVKKAKKIGVEQLMKVIIQQGLKKALDID